VPFPDVSARTLRDLWSLAGKGVVVTGGAKGIGFATACRLAEAGASVLVADRDAAAAESASLRLQERGLSILTEVADVSDSAAVGHLAERAIAQLPTLHGWVNNAVNYMFGRTLDLSDADWDEGMATNLRGVFLCCREAGKAMSRNSSGGVIVNVTSTEAHRGMPRSPQYIAAKHGVLGLSRTLAIELGRFGIRVLTVAPTLIDTEGMAEMVAAMGEEGRARWSDRLPAGRLGVPDDVARVILFALSDMSVMMTGSVLMVDGGEMTGINKMRLL